MSRRFPAATTSVGQARRFLIEQLPEGSDKGGDALVLMLSELATNTVQHAATEFEVSVHIAVDASSVHVEVSDDAGGYPTRRTRSGTRPTGRGLHIVRTLADAWGIEMHRGREGKTVWFSSALPASDRPVTETVTEPPSGRAGPDGNGAAESPAPPVGTAAVEPTFPVKGVRAVLDGLQDAIVATDERGQIRYANAAAEDLMGWPHGSLVGRSALDLVPDALAAPLKEGFESFLRTQADELVGRRLAAVTKAADGSDVHTELVISMFDHPLAGRVVVGILRPRDDQRLQRWSELTSELLEILADAPIEDPPAERVA